MQNNFGPSLATLCTVTERLGWHTHLLLASTVHTEVWHMCSKPLDLESVYVYRPALDRDERVHQLLRFKVALKLSTLEFPPHATRLKRSEDPNEINVSPDGDHLFNGQGDLTQCFILSRGYIAWARGHHC